MRGDVVFVNFKNILEKKDDLCEEISSLLNLKENWKERQTSALALNLNQKFFISNFSFNLSWIYLI